MITAMLIASTVAGAPAQMVMCVEMSPGKTAAAMDARGEGWFVKGAPLTIGNSSYAKAGGPIGMAPSDLTLLQRYGDATVYSRATNTERDTLYVLADIRDCTFQPYRIVR